MTDESTRKTDPVRSQDSRKQGGGGSGSGSPSTSSSPGSTYGDPAHRDFGDKPGDSSNKRKEASKVTDKSGLDDDLRTDGDEDDEGEGHKGPRGETTTRTPGTRPQTGRTQSGSSGE